jgi:hypothetical protein
VVLRWAEPLASGRSTTDVSENKAFPRSSPLKFGRVSASLLLAGHGGEGEKRWGGVRHDALLFLAGRGGEAVAARRKSGAGRHPRLGFLQVGVVHGASEFPLLLDLVTLVVMEKEGWVMLHRRVGLVWLLQLRFTSDGVCRRSYP